MEGAQVNREKIWVLLEHIDTIDKARGSIVLRWVSDAEVAEILAAHGIDQLHFADTYAHPVLGYFIDVILGNQQIGNCPVISKLLDYLKAQEISASELFVICTHFRKAVVEELFDKGCMDARLFDAVSYVFDNNFAGVLEAYTTTIYRAQQEAREHQQLLEQYGIAMDEGNLVSKTDAKGMITYVNDKFCRVSGYGREELLGKSHNIVRHADESSETYRRLWETIRRKEVFHGIIKNRAKDGSAYYVDATILPILDLEGSIREYVAIRHDVTDLVEARDRAIEAERTKDQFLANMSHELRTPLNAILGFVHILQKRLSTEDRNQEYLAIIHKSGENLLAILSDILDFAKIKNGAMRIEEKHYRLREALEAAVEFFANTAREKGIAFTAFVDPQLPIEVLGDPVRLNQIVTNLLSNAMKFTPEGGRVHLEAALRRSNLVISVEDTGPGVPEAMQERIFLAFEQVESGDTREHGGTGLGLSISSKLATQMGGEIALRSIPGEGSTFTLTIPVKKIVTTAEAFQPLAGSVVMDESTAQSDAGALLSRYFNAMYPGALEVVHDMTAVDSKTVVVGSDAAVGQTAASLAVAGNRVIVMGGEETETCSQAECLGLPFHAGTLQRLFAGRRSSHGSGDTGVFEAHVLLVEDHKANQQLMQIMLEDAGISSEVANNGAEAVELFKKGRFDLVLMDQQMPVMNGIEATRLIRRHEQESGSGHTPILALTANVMPDDIERYMANGMDDYLKKPVEQKWFTTLLEKYLPQRHHNKEQTTMNIPNYANLDAETLAAKIGLKAKHIPILIASFTQESAELLGALKAAIAAKDFEQIQHHAHSIKGSSGNLKFDELYEMAKAMELAAKAQDGAFDYDGVCAAIEAGVATISL